MEPVSKTTTDSAPGGVKAGYFGGPAFGTSPPWVSSPILALVIILAAVFSVEAVLMVFLNLLPEEWGRFDLFIDTFLLTVLVFPVLYFLMVKPMQLYIEQRERAEEQIRKSSELLENLFSNEYYGILLMDPSLKILRFNHAFAAASGLEASEIHEQSYFSIISDQEQEKVFRQVLETGQPSFNYDKPFRNQLKPEGETSYWDWNLLPIKDENGIVRLLILTLLDRSKHDLTAVALRQTQRNYEALVNSIEGIVWEADVSTFSFTFVSRQAEHLLGYPINRWTEEPSFWREHIYEDDRDWAVNYCLAATKQKLDHEFQYRMVSTSGELVWLRDLVHVVVEEDEPVKLRGIMVDITKQKKDEEELKQRTRELTILHAIGTAISTTLDLKDLMAELERLLRLHLEEWPGGALYLYDTASKGLNLEVTWGILHQACVEMGQAEWFGKQTAGMEDGEMKIQAGSLADLKPELQLGEDECQPEYKCYLSIPLPGRGQMLGVLFLFGLSEGRISLRQQNFFSSLGHEVGAAVQNARLFEAELRARQTAEAFSAASLALTESLEPERVMLTLLYYANSLAPYDYAHVLLLEDENKLILKASMPPSGNGVGGSDGTGYEDKITISAEATPIFGELIEEARSILLPVLLPEHKVAELPGMDEIGSYLAAPLVNKGKVVGLCGLGKAEPGFYQPSHQRLLEALGGQAAVVIENAWLFEQVRAGRERLQMLSRQLVEVQEAERRYVARELHDEAGQALTSILYGLSLLEHDSQGDKTLLANVGRIKQITNEVLENVHRLAKDLMPSTLEHLGLVDAIAYQVKEVGDLYGLEAQFKAVGVDENAFRHEIETAVYRIVQEALTNVVRHAKARNVNVLLEKSGSSLKVLIEDDGAGFDLNSLRRRERLGLVGMQQRAEMLGGELVLESSPGMGTTVVVEVPDADTDIDS
jgi:PAS domain S-box-containing protein